MQLRLGAASAAWRARHLDSRAQSSQRPALPFTLSATFFLCTQTPPIIRRDPRQSTHLRGGRSAGLMATGDEE